MADETRSESIPKLSKNNYYVWSRRARAELVERNCWNAVDPGFDDKVELNETQARLNRKAIAFLLKSVSDAYVEDIGEIHRAKEAWEKLARIHSSYTLPQCLEMLREMVNIVKTEEMSMHDYMAKLQSYNRRIHSGGFGLELSDAQLAGQFLIGLPKERYGLLVNFISREPNLNTEKVKSVLLREEVVDTPQNTSGALASKKQHFERGNYRGKNNRGRSNAQQYKNNMVSRQHDMGVSNVSEDSRKCFHCQEWGHISKNCPNVRCYRCGITGHLAKNCTTKEAEKNEQKSSQVPDREEKVKYRSYVSASGLVSPKKTSDEWVLDSAASDHMCYRRNLFKTFEPCHGTVSMGKGSASVKGCGTVEITMTEECGGWTLSLSNVLYVPEFQYNLISGYKLATKGVVTELHDSHAVGLDGEDIIFRAETLNGLYILKVLNKPYTAATSSSPMKDDNDTTSEEISAVALRSIQIWHDRLGHLHEAAIKKIPNISVTGKFSELCSVCVQGKFVKIVFPKGSERATTEPLKLVHSDVMGKLPESLGGSCYIVTFVDDYSRHLTVRFIEKKSQVFEVFKDYKAEVEMFHNTKIKAIQTDGGGEYCSKEFEGFLSKNGIVHRKTVAGSPEQNGIAERMNRTIANAVRCMLIQSGLPEAFWAEAANCASYVKNLSPSRSIHNQIPLEIWRGESIGMTEYERLRVFGCRGWSRVEKQGKFGKRGVECIFLGYEPNVKGYRVWVRNENKVKIVHHVIFEETVFPYLEKAKGNHVEESCNFPFNFGINLEPSEMTNVSEKNADCSDVTPNGDKNNIIIGENFADDLFEETTKANVDGRSDDCSDSSGHSEDSESIITVPFLGWDNNEITETNSSERICYEIVPNIRRSERVCKPRVCSCCEITQYCHDACNSGKCYVNTKEGLGYTEPSNIAEALKGEDAVLWERAMLEEMVQLKNKNTYVVVDRPKNQNILGSKWVYKVKKGANGEIERYKARVVARGFNQVYGVDYHQTYSPVIQRKTVRLLFSLAACNGWTIEHVDVLTAYLNSPLVETVYIEQPEGFLEGENKVWKLQKGLYGLKQSALEWYKTIDNILIKLGLSKLKKDRCVYVNLTKNLIVGLYVDDLGIWGKPNQVKWVKGELEKILEIRDLGNMHSFLSINVRVFEGAIEIDQSHYLQQVLDDFNLSEAHTKGRAAPLPLNSDDKTGAGEEPFDPKLYQNAVGKLLYLSSMTRPDISFAVSKLSMKTKNPTKKHWHEVKHVVRYLGHTNELKLKYKKGGAYIQAFCDADWGNDKSDRKSISGYVFLLAGAPIIWRTKKQTTVALSTVEAEFNSMCEAAKEALWLTMILEELGQGYIIDKPFIIQCDNLGSMSLAKNGLISERSKHIPIKLCFLNDLVNEGKIKFQYVPTNLNVADLFTKALSGVKTSELVKALGLTK